MKFRRNKPKVGYQKDPKNKIKKEHSWLSSLFIAPQKQISIQERVVKFLIYIALRLVIRPKHWKHPKKNYEIIDRTYKRIMSADFIFIPSSIAFYLIMAFMPILSIILLIYMIPGFGGETGWLTTISGGSRDPIAEIIGKFIPGTSDLLKSLQGYFDNTTNKGIQAGASVAIILSLFVSTWIASGGFAKLIFTQSYIYEHKYVGGYWMNKIKGMSMVLGFTIYLVISLAFNILMTSWINRSGLSSEFQQALKYIWLVVGIFLLIFIGFIILYKFSPRYKIKLKHVIPGAMVTTIPAAGFLTLFGMISNLWSYGKYGAIGAIMYVGMASLLITYFIFVGLTANAAYYKTFVGNKVKNKWTLSRK